jgi:cytochrome c2
MAACKLYYPVEKVEYKTTANSIAEGKRLTMLTCGPCHYNGSTKNYSGKRLEDSRGILGKIFASNITQDKEFGIGEYTDSELAYLIRTGLSRKGKLMPYMKRPNIADEDLQNIIAYLKSRDELVKPSKRVAGKTKYSPMGKLGISMSKPLPFPDQVIKKPSNDTIASGKYLVENLGCFHCHSKSFPSLDITDPEKSKGYMGGGNKMKNAAGKTMRSPNITFHATGIGDWTESDFKRVLTEGMTKENEIVTFPMPLYPELTDEEISSMYAYLKSIPQINNAVQ